MSGLPRFTRIIVPWSVLIIIRFIIRFVTIRPININLISVVTIIFINVSLVGVVTIIFININLIRIIAIIFINVYIIIGRSAIVIIFWICFRINFITFYQSILGFKCS